MSKPTRTARIERQTSESKVTLSLDLDGTGQSAISTGVGFYDHMLTALAKHSLIDLEVTSVGDWGIDAHHTVEDTAIVLGRPCEPRSATRRASAGSVTPWCRWTRRWPRRWWTCPVGPTACIPVNRRVSSTSGSAATRRPRRRACRTPAR